MINESTSDGMSFTQGETSSGTLACAITAAPTIMATSELVLKAQMDGRWDPSSGWRPCGMN